MTTGLSPKPQVKLSISIMMNLAAKRLIAPSGGAAARCFSSQPNITIPVELVSDTVRPPFMFVQTIMWCAYSLFALANNSRHCSYDPMGTSERSTYKQLCDMFFPIH